MSDHASLLQELEESISHGSDQARLRALWHATDILIAGQFSEEDVWIFGEVIERLAREIELEARAQLSRKISRLQNAPVSLVNRLARDNSIAVAGPVLTHSDRLDTPNLVSIATVGSQQHLLAISKRRSIAEPVTDVLVVRGNRDVLHSLSGNAGAHFSDRSFLQLIQRSESDSILLESVGVRKDIPRSIFQQLIAKASEESRKKLERERPDMAAEIATLVSDITGDLHSIFGPASKNYFLAKKAVSTLHQYENLHEKAIFGYAQAHQFPEVIAGLSLLCSLPANAIERGLADPSGEVPLILAKFLGFSWETTMSLLFLGAESHKISGRKFDELEAKFSRLKNEAAQSVIQLYQSRKGRRE
jgi:rRNA processing protein Gar1